MERLYQEAKLQVRRRKRKKVLLGERQPLGRPLAPIQVWSMDFVFDRTADGRVIKCLTIFGDATHESAGLDPLVASPRINQYEKGQHVPHHTTAKRLAKVLGVPTAFLFAEDEQLAKLLLLWADASPAQRKKLLKQAEDAFKNKRPATRPAD